MPSLQNKSTPVMLINHPFLKILQVGLRTLGEDFVQFLCQLGKGKSCCCTVFKWVNQKWLLDIPSACTVDRNWSDHCKCTELETISCLGEWEGDGWDNYWLWNWKYNFTVKHFQRYCRLKFQSISRGSTFITHTDVSGNWAVIALAALWNFAWLLLFQPLEIICFTVSLCPPSI